MPFYLLFINSFLSPAAYIVLIQQKESDRELKRKEKEQYVLNWKQNVIKYQGYSQKENPCAILSSFINFNPSQVLYLSYVDDAD